MLKSIKRIANEFKTFAIRGNVVDMAIGVVIGAAFGKIIDSLVKDIIMPPLGWLMGRVDFTNLYITLPDYDGKIAKYPSLEVAQKSGAVTINYGIFINTLIGFIIVAFSVFLVVKMVNKIRAKSESKKSDKVVTKTCPRCFSIIDIKATKCPYCTADI